jgi:hypothetical protein
MLLQYFGPLVLRVQRCPKKPSGHGQTPLSLSHDLEQPCGRVIKNLFCDILFCNEYKRTLLISKFCYLPVTREVFAKKRDMCFPEVEPFQRVFPFFKLNIYSCKNNVEVHYDSQSNIKQIRCWLLMPYWIHRRKFTSGGVVFKSSNRKLLTCISKSCNYRT